MGWRRGRALKGISIRTTPSRALRDALIVVAGVLSLFLIIFTPLFTAEDWNAIQHGSRLVLAGQSPFQEALYRWSPLAAWLGVPLLAVPYWAWVGLHLVALLALLDPVLIVIGLLAWPFWQDAGLGNVLIFVVVAAYWALRGNRILTWAYVVMCLLMPRPLVVPVLVWLLWTRPALRLWFVALAIASLAGAFVTGYGIDWLTVLVSKSGSDMANPYQVGPSAIVGAVWVPIGLFLALILTWRAQLGLASLAASPYWLPYYLLMGLLDIRPHRSMPEPQPAPQKASTSRSASAIE